MKKIIPYGRHYIDNEDIKAVENVLRHKNLTQGNEVEYFEKEVAKYVGAKYAVAISSWTSGLHIANMAMNLKEGDEVITSPITFVASSNSILYCDATPIFADIEEESINICPNEIEKVIASSNKIKGIIPVHFAGVTCNMKKINKIAKKNNLFVIEDAAHALGARYKDGTMVGSCKYSDMTGFSFHPVKSIAAGEGGMITTNNFNIYKKLLRLRSHGINKLDDKFINTDQSRTDHIINPWYYEMLELGYNYRITDIQCALGRSQLKKLKKFIERRKVLVERYDKAFKNFKNITPIQTEYREKSSHHLYVIKVNFSKIKSSRAEIMMQLRDKGIYTQVHYIPVTSHPYYQNLGYKTSDYPISLKYYNNAISIPLYYSLSNTDQDFVVKLLKKLIG